MNRVAVEALWRLFIEKVQYPSLQRVNIDRLFLTTASDMHVRLNVDILIVPKVGLIQIHPTGMAECYKV